MNRYQRLVGAVLLLTGIACSDAMAPADATGRFTLLSINGEALPAVVAQGAEFSTAVTEGYLEIHERTCTQVHVIVSTVGAIVLAPDTLITPCTWEWEGIFIRFTNVDGLGGALATLVGDVLTVANESGNVFVYERPPS